MTTTMTDDDDQDAADARAYARGARCGDCDQVTGERCLQCLGDYGPGRAEFNAGGKKEIRISLTDAQVSALECAGLELDPDDSEAAMVLHAWRDSRLVFDDRYRAAMAEAINELSNREDGHAEETGCPMARRASASLAALAGKIRKAK